ncbi:butyrophilin subfamily 1 member A1-like isoform X2 [Dromaius novaehollandiae]|uniref:butyrophilin subfamily 1 member A1-like isoform X2 n=1 Tax=Dromaius novaehollandiae TaxID=8790 RepID=UPI00311DA284
MSCGFSADMQVPELEIEEGEARADAVEEMSEKGQMVARMKLLSFFRASCPLPHFVICFLMLCIPELEAAQVSRRGADSPILLVTVGADAVLPCSLTPSRSPRPVEVTWLQVLNSWPWHHSHAGTARDGAPGHSRRTVLQKRWTCGGHADLRLSGVGPSNEGRYTCLVQNKIKYEGARLELKVTATGSAPYISMESYQGGVRAVCRSAGWYPQPQMVWRDPNHQLLLQQSQTHSQDERGLFEARSTLVIIGNTTKNLSCVVRNIYLNQEKETAFQTPDFSQAAYPGMGVLTMILTVFGFIGFVAYLSKTKANMTLDPATVHPWLLLSKDGRGVRWGEEQQELPETPEQFDTWRCVLGREGFSAGRHAWEVTVGGGKSWGVGLARASLKRKGRTYLGPEEGVWAVVKLEEVFRALTSPERTPLPQSCVPRRIRVSLEYDKGQVAFSDAETDAPIFTFPPASFRGEKIHLWLWVWDKNWLRLAP